MNGEVHDICQNKLFSKRRNVSQQQNFRLGKFVAVGKIKQIAHLHFRMSLITL
jgi:hypothetical protein